MIVHLSSLATLVCSASPVRGRQDLSRDPVSYVSSKEGGGEENQMMNGVSTYQSEAFVAFELF